MTKTQKLYAYMVAGSSVGLVAAFWQTLEKLTLLKNKDAVLSCNLSSVFSCNNVLNAWQSSVFGFPNSIMCIILFSLFLGVGLAGVTGSKLAKKLQLSIHFLAVFMLGFGLWFLGQSTYRIGAICIFCIFCFLGLVAINYAWLRINIEYLAKGKWIKQQLKEGADRFIWLLLILVVGAAIVFKFYV